METAAGALPVPASDAEAGLALAMPVLWEVVASGKAGNASLDIGLV